MRRMKKNLVPLVICIMALLVSGVLTGCSLDRKANDASARTENTQVKKEAPAAGQPTPTLASKQEAATPQQESNGEDKNQDISRDVQSEEEDTDGEDDSNDSSEIPPQGFLTARLYSAYGGFVDIERAEDGEFYDSSGVLYPGVDEANTNLDPVTNEEGSTFYWRESDVEALTELPFQGESQAMVYDIDTGEGFVIKRGEDNIWRDGSGVSFGDVEDALIAGEPVTNENGETYYWTLPQE